MATTPSLAEVIKSGVERKLANTYVARPARVERFDAAKCLVDVKPLLKESAEDDEGNPVSVSLPVISNVPVVFPGAGGFRVTLPVSKGDTVLLVFSDRSLDRWISQGGEIDPVEDARHSLSDAIAIPGLNAVTDAWTGVSTSNMTLGKDGGAQIEITPTEIRAGGSDAVALAGALATWLAAHVHTGGTISGSTGPPTVPPTVGPIPVFASNVLKGS